MTFLKHWVNLPALALFLSTSIPAAPTQARPNIVYIYADDLGYGDLEPYGQTKIKTPNMTALSEEGMRFTQHYTGSPVCAPARCILLTGRHSGHSFIRGNYEMGGYGDHEEGGQMPLPEGTRTIAHMLKEGGYATACVGKWGMGMVQTTGHPNRQGFDYFFGYLDQKQAHNYYPTHLWENEQRFPLKNDYRNVHQFRGNVSTGTIDVAAFHSGDYAPDHITTKALEFIENSKGGPFFLYFAPPFPHVSLQPPANALNPYKGLFDEEPYYGSQGYAPHPTPRAAYAALISEFDRSIGALWAKLKQLGLDSNTIIMISSDNGPAFNGGTDSPFFNSSGGLRGGKTDVFEGGIRVPMIARWANHIPAGTVTAHVSVQYDVFATLAELCGFPAPTGTDGISFAAELLGQTGQQKKHEILYFEFPEKGGQLAVRMGDWKAVKRDMRKTPQGPWELYNLANDEDESVNLASQYPERIKQAEAIVAREHLHPTANEWEFVDPKIQPVAP